MLYQGIAQVQRCFLPTSQPLRGLSYLPLLLEELQQGNAQALSIPPNRVKKILLNVAILNLQKLLFLVNKVGRMHDHSYDQCQLSAPLVLFSSVGPQK